MSYAAEYAQRIKDARKDELSKKAAYDEHFPDFDETSANLLPLDPSAGGAKTDIEFYQRRGE